MGEEEDDQDQDSVKEAFLETNIYLLVCTFVISIVHSVFEFLAFKNDIQFWKERKTTEGLSVRTVFFNVFQNVIVVLYVFDNDTNPMIKISCFVGLAIECWKVTKVSDCSFDFENKVLGLIPRLVINEKKEYDESGTKEFDRMAFKYLGMACFPLGICYCIYSVIYNEHKGWYSFVLGSCYGFLLTFGFIMMTPQLFINYKLKSVAHLPWRMMTYKALNTFIDDIFAFDQNANYVQDWLLQRRHRIFHISLSEICIQSGPLKGKRVRIFWRYARRSRKEKNRVKC